MRSRRCPECGAACAPEHRFCQSCGANLAAGVVGRGAPVPEEEGPGLAGPLLWFLELFPGLVRPVVLVMSVAAIVVAAAVGWLALYLFGLGGMISAFFIGGFAVVVYWTGLAWLLYGYIAFPSEAMAEFQSKHWMALLIFTLVPLGLVFWGAKQVGVI